MASWGCPNEIEGKCVKVDNLPCDPGMKGCVLAGRYFFTSNDDKGKHDKNQRFREKLARDEAERRKNALK